MKHALFAAATLALLGTMSAANAGGDAAAGKAKTAVCAGCHGANGEGKDKNPPLAGKPEAELVQALHDYKSGKRKNAMMKTFATPLGDQDMANLAAYYASLKAK
jgi:cytochrome c553